MGLDFGSKTTGVAVSDELGITAQGIETIRRKSPKKLRQTLARIEELARQYHIRRIILGLPKNMDNSLGERAEATIEFQQMLMKRTGLAVELWDERLSTLESERILMEAGVRREHRKERIDWMAAAVILQSYMDAHPVPDDIPDIMDDISDDN
jgi:putative Holliday junction resolvase